MKKLEELQNLLTPDEQLTSEESETIKGGRRGRLDDKRRQRPGGGATTTSPTRQK